MPEPPNGNYKDARSWAAWAILAGSLLALILVPFFVFEESINARIAVLLHSGLPRGAAAAAIVVLLMLDVFLPVPSSVVSTAAGSLLGFAAGSAACTTGMTAGCLLGWLCGRRFGLPLVRRMVRARDVEEVAAAFRRGAPWALATMRTVPVLAEASALVAGVSRVPLGQYLLITTLANAGISAVYCAAGARALDTGSILLAFAASMALPGCAIAIRRLVRRAHVSADDKSSTRMQPE